jgi:hypothetical protein
MTLPQKPRNHYHPLSFSHVAKPEKHPATACQDPNIPWRYRHKLNGTYYGAKKTGRKRKESTAQFDSNGSGQL